MNVVLTIEGKEAIPVRALAYVTSWRANPDEIVKACAMPPTKEIGSYSIRNRQALPTYLVSESTYRSMLSVEWEPFIVELECMEKKLKADERTDGENWHHSREQAIMKLPTGVFVWLEDFRQWFSYTRPLKDEPTTGQEEPRFEQESDSLTLDPYIPAESQGDVFSGFDRFLQVPTTETPVAELANKSNEFQEGCAGTKRTHEIQKGRKHALAAIIAVAKNNAADADDYQSVWAALVRLAESRDRPAPLLGYVEDDGIKYQGASEVKFFIKDALRKQMNRTASKIGQ